MKLKRITTKDGEVYFVDSVTGERVKTEMDTLKNEKEQAEEMYFINEKDTNDKKDNNSWKIVLILLCGLILGYGYFFSRNDTFEFYYLIGFNLPLALTIWGVFYATVARKCSSKIVGYSFLIIFLALMASELIGYYKQRNNEKLALNEIQSQYGELIDSLTDSQGVPKRLEKPMDITPKASGEYGELERFSKEFFNQMASLRNDYLLEIEAIGWNGILEANRIKADKTFIESKLIIQKAKEVIGKYSNKTERLLENVNDQMNGLNISEAKKKIMRDGYESGMKKARVNMDLLWSLEMKVISEYENVINLLAAKRNGWVVSGEEILFYNESDLNRFNHYINNIDRIAQQQKQIQTQGVQAVNRNFDRAKEIN